VTSEHFFVYFDTSNVGRIDRRGKNPASPRFFGGYLFTRSPGKCRAAAIISPFLRSINPARNRYEIAVCFFAKLEISWKNSLGRSLDLKIGAFLRVEISGVCPKLLPIKENLISKGLCDRK